MFNFSFMWFSLIFLFLFLEMGHPGLLYFLSFSFGSLCACIATLYDASIVSQFGLFIAGVCGALYAMHYWFGLKNKQLQIPSHRSNLDALIGQKVIVIVSEDNNIAQARVAGQLWLVRSVHNENLVAGQQVVIVDVQGCHLRVDSIQ